ncbi:hypothetical protein [Yersinia frederiksenii]|uniref:hypothetical protein n=1 Tax=Yersinia frederiksenii TaxID=29484 RepID=UPI0005DBAAF5|nr:hypothetical protein [Yersinia frederiksenii]CFR14825.1 Uncharacterised protein [Yersinia frederiksenii]
MSDLDTFTVEDLKEIINSPANELTIALARIALSAKQAEPVAYWHDGCDFDEGAFSYAKQGGCTRPLYTTPQLNSPEIPEGWKLVPIAPTRQMMAQGHFAMGGTDRGKFMRIYQAMLNAAPEKGNG